MKARRAPGSAPAAGGTPCHLLAVIERTAAHHPERVESGGSAVVAGIIGIRLIGTSRPLPNIAAHVRQAVHAIRTCNAAYRNGASASQIRAVGAEIFSPWVATAIRSSRCLFPFGLAWQRDVPARVEPLLQRRQESPRTPSLPLKPAAISECVGPRYKSHGMSSRRSERLRLDLSSCGCRRRPGTVRQ